MAKKAQKTIDASQDMFTNFFAKMGEQHLERIQKFYGMWEDMDTKSAQQSTQFVNEMTKMSNASIDYFTKLNAQYRDMTLASFEAMQERAS